MLGIPTVTSRLVQQAIAQWLSPKYEEEFSEYSYGFRERRNAHQAVLQAQSNLNEGYEWIIELDLEKFFDRVNHDKLMGLLAKNGRSTKSFINEGRWDSVMQNMKAGDYVLIQFGHNDEVPTKATYTPEDQFVANLIRFIKESRDKKARA